jgi:hypothetical protein
MRNNYEVVIPKKHNPMSVRNKNVSKTLQILKLCIRVRRMISFVVRKSSLVLTGWREVLSAGL